MKDHLICGARSDDVNRLNPFKIFKAGEIPLKGVTLVVSIEGKEYISVDLEIVGIPSF